MDELNDVVVQHLIITWGVTALLTQWRRLCSRKLGPLIPGPPGIRDHLVGQGKVRKNRYKARAKKGLYGYSARTYENSTWAETLRGAANQHFSPTHATPLDARQFASLAPSEGQKGPLIVQTAANGLETDTDAPHRF
jgi:hypothetical protein